MKIKAYAKVNLALDIVGVLDNGYHDLDMIMAPVSLYDEINIQESQIDEVFCDGMDIGQNNTIIRMIQAIKEYTNISDCFYVNVLKHIPMMSGMAGGSADAAAVLKAIMKMKNLSLSIEEQIQLSKKVGADVPFCVVGQWARVQGIGEKIRCLDTNWEIPCLIVKPKQGISTPVAFKKWHERKPIHVDVDSIEQAIIQKDFDLLISLMNNTLEPVAKEMEPVLCSIQKDMEECGISRVMMSGSGSSMMGFSQNIQILQETKKKLKKKYEFVNLVMIGGNNDLFDS
ncbi:4-(cytidine 5'-diphospho)-2-C-methyl-D-erythritol kinase [Floccifex sp.]|uniref:4-(cytidine 5'-diphospho)-2-C-methyl-D-erythritol kinase n=1 Tax=Floccifex sp. TaxID=2815810 RepID=UPI003F11A291